MFDNCSALIIGVNIRSHFSSSLSSRHTLLPQIIPSIIKTEYLEAFVWAQSLQAPYGTFSTTLFFSVALRLNYLFFLFGAEKLQEFFLLLLLGYQCYDRCTPFSVIFTLIDHPCFNFEENFFVNLSLSNFSPPRNMAHTLLP